MTWEKDENENAGESWNPVGATSEKEEGFTPVPGGDENGGFEMNGDHDGGEEGDRRGGGGGACHNCEQEGHFSKECSAPRKMICRNCDKEGHFAKDCLEPKKLVCRGCNQEGHAQKDCPQEPCRFCREDGHVMSDCPTRLAIPCKKCQKPGHLAVDCESKTRTEDTSDIVSASIEDAWIMLKKASEENDLDAFKDAFFIYVKACPEATFDELDSAFRRQEMVYNLVAIEKEIPPTQTIVDLQGNEDKKYTVTFQKGLTGRRARLAQDGRYPKDNDENAERLANAGFVKESFELMCRNCNQKGHSSRACPAEAQEKVNQQPEIKCINCDQVGHRARDCDQERKAIHDPNACRNCGKPGHTSRECEEPRDPSTMQCRKCEKMGHMSKDCPDAPKRTCFNCGEEGHGKQDCTNERVPICRNCDERGHMSRDCPQPPDPTKIKCRKCEQMGHRERDCTGEAKPQEDIAQDSNSYGNNDYTNNTDDAPAVPAESWQNSPEDQKINATWGS